MTWVFAASLLVTIPHVAWLTARCHCSDCSLPASHVPASKNGHNEPTLPDHTWDHFFLVGTIPRSIRIYVPNLVMIGPAVWPPILDTHTQNLYYIYTNWLPGFARDPPSPPPPLPPIRPSLLPSLPRITRLRPEYLECHRSK